MRCGSTSTCCGEQRAMTAKEAGIPAPNDCASQGSYTLRWLILPSYVVYSYNVSSIRLDRSISGG